MRKRLKIIRVENEFFFEMILRSWDFRFNNTETFTFEQKSLYDWYKDKSSLLVVKIASNIESVFDFVSNISRISHKKTSMFLFSQISQISCSLTTFIIERLLFRWEIFLLFTVISRRFLIESSRTSFSIK